MFATRQFQLQSMIVPCALFTLVFSYLPMGGIIMAFQDYNIFKGFFGSRFVGLKQFEQFFLDPNVLLALKNTMGMNVLGLVLGFPIPIIFALLLNEMRNLRFKKLTQTISYLPHFVSWAIFGGLIITILNPDSGFLNQVLIWLGVIKDPVLFIAKPEYFWFIAVLSGILKEFGWGSILYIAAMAGINPELYDAGIVDGAGRFNLMRYITLPSIAPTMIIMLIFAISYITSSDFDRSWILMNPLNASSSEVLATYTFKLGIQNMRYSFATAIGLTQSIVSIILLVSANFVAKKASGSSLF